MVVTITNQSNCPRQDRPASSVSVRPRNLMPAISTVKTPSNMNGRYWKSALQRGNGSRTAAMGRKRTWYPISCPVTKAVPQIVLPNKHRAPKSYDRCDVLKQQIFTKPLRFIPKFQTFVTASASNSTEISTCAPTKPCIARAQPVVATLPTPCSKFAWNGFSSQTKHTCCYCYSLAWRPNL